MEEHIAAWKSQVYDRANYIDPDNEKDWYDLAFGWALGRGMEPEVADFFAQHVYEIGLL